MDTRDEKQPLNLPSGLSASTCFLSGCKIMRHVPWTAYEVISANTEQQDNADKVGAPVQRFVPDPKVFVAVYSI